MPEPLSSPFMLSYEGGEAQEMRVDAALLGQSLQGSARLYNSVARFWFYGDIPRRLVPTIRVSAGPPQSGSVVYLIYLLMTHGQLAVFPSLLFAFADQFIPLFVRAVFARRAGRFPELDKALDTIAQMAERQAGFAELVHRDHVTEKARLIGVVENLTASNTPALAQMSRPIGPSVRRLVHFKETSREVTVDEPLAEVFKSKEELVVGDQTTYRARLLAVDKAAGTCRVQIEGAERLVRGKITDPVLEQPGNVYTHSLDTDRLVTITAKPVIREGEIATLYISDAGETS